MASLAAPLVFTLVHAALITVRGGGPGDCPSRLDLEEALRTRLPGAVAATTLAEAPGVLRLDLASDPAGAFALRLSDGTGTVVLERALPPAPAMATRSECAALADTVAIIVERYLEQLAVRESPPAAAAPATRAAAPRWTVLVLAGARLVSPDQWPAGARLGLAAGPVLGTGPVRAYLLGRVGLSWPAELSTGAELRRVEASMEPGAAFGRGPWQLHLGAALGAERTGIAQGTPAAVWSPWAGPRVAALWAPLPRIVIRGSVGADVLVGRLRIESAGGGMMEPLYAAPPARLHVGLEIGGTFF